MKEHTYSSRYHLPEEQEASTRERLLAAGKDAFYKNGYLRASLRQICAACGVTTGAFYFFFPSKEALLCAIVDPVIDEWLSLTELLAEEERKDPLKGQDFDRKLMEFEFSHREEILILAEGTDGSCRESFKNTLMENLERIFHLFFEAAIGRRAKPEIIRLLVQFRYESNISILKGAYDMEQALFLSKVLGCYADGGTRHLITELNDVL